MLLVVDDVGSADCDGFLLHFGALCLQDANLQAQLDVQLYVVAIVGRDLLVHFGVEVLFAAFVRLHQLVPLVDLLAALA